MHDGSAPPPPRPLATQAGITQQSQHGHNRIDPAVPSRIVREYNVQPQTGVAGEFDTGAGMRFDT